MKILMVAPEPFFEPRGTPFSVLGRLKALSHLGMEIDLVTYHLGEDVTIPGVRIYRISSIPFIKRVPIGPSFRKLFLDIFLALKVVSLLRKNQYVLLHSHEEASFFSLYLAAIFKVAHLYDMHSSLPQQLRNFEYTRFKPLIRIFEWLENKVINSSQAIITICPALEDHVRNINPSAPQVMIENTFTEISPEEVTVEDVANFKALHGINRNEIVLYAGTFEPYQGLELLFESAAQVVDSRPNVLFFLMGGNSSQVEHHRKLVNRLGLSQYFRFTGTQPPQDIPRAVQAADILVSPRVGGTNTPLKIYSYLQSGKPIVATNLPTHTQVLNSTVAILVDPNPQALAKGLLTVLETPGVGEKLGNQARQLYEDQYGFQSYIEKTNRVLQLILA